MGGDRQGDQKWAFSAISYSKLAILQTFWPFTLISSGYSSQGNQKILSFWAILFSELAFLGLFSFISSGHPGGRGICVSNPFFYFKSWYICSIFHCRSHYFFIFPTAPASWEQLKCPIFCELWLSAMVEVIFFIHLSDNSSIYAVCIMMCRLLVRSCFV